MYRLRVVTLLVFLIFMGCKEEKNNNQDVNNIGDLEQPENKIKSIIDSLTVDTTYHINDVRRYGMLPNKGVGVHPKTKKKIIDEIIRLAEYGQYLEFPSGYFKTPLILSGKSDINLRFNKTVFAGGILINGTEASPSGKISLKGNVSTYSTFNCSFVDDVSIDSLSIKNNKEYNISGMESSGCNIYNGTKSLYIDYLEIEGTGSESDQFRYTPAGLMIHGNSPKPYDVLIKEAYIRSSDRHGAYLSGNFIEIDTLKINSYALGTIDNLQPIAYTKSGDEKKITGLWLNRFNNSTINNLVINTEVAKKAMDAIYLDVGDSDSPSHVYNITLTGTKKGIRKAEATNVNLN